MFMKADGIQHLLELSPTVVGRDVEHCLFTNPASPHRDMCLHLGRPPELLEADLRNMHEQASSVLEYM